MGLEGKMDAREMVKEVGMSSQPEFYSGRGATSSDLNSEILEKTYQLVKREQGDNPAEQFVQMVADIPKLSATDYLLTFYRLEGNGWEWDKKLLGDENGIDVGPDLEDGSREATGLFTVGNVLSGDGSRDETVSIRYQFLFRHGIEDPRGEELGYFFR